MIALGHHIVTSTMNCPTTSNQSSAPSRPVNPYSSKKDWTKIEIENDEEENDPKKMSVFCESCEVDPCRETKVFRHSSNQYIKMLMTILVKQ